MHEGADGWKIKRKKRRDAEAGTYNGQKTFCPMDDWSCPYNKDGVCHIDDPFEDCDEWCAYCEAEDWDEWEDL